MGSGGDGCFVPFSLRGGRGFGVNLFLRERYKPPENLTLHQISDSFIGAYMPFILEWKPWAALSKAGFSSGVFGATLS